MITIGNILTCIALKISTIPIIDIFCENLFFSKDWIRQHHYEISRFFEILKR